MRRLLTAVSVASVVVCAQAIAQTQAPERPSGWTEKTPLTARHWMVAAANPLAVEAGYRILKQGGNAVDAAITVQLVLGLAEPQSSLVALEPKLKALGAQVLVMDHTSGLQAIQRTKTGWIGGADPRREGIIKGE
jgi:gamma-glutamyltranspeptidase